MDRYVGMLESIKNEMDKEIESYPIDSIRRNLLVDYSHEISEIQDKIIPGTSDKKHTIEFLSVNKDKIELSNVRLQNEDKIELSNLKFQNEDNITFTEEQKVINNRRDDTMYYDN